MVKVVIADDEVRICQLIQALVDWEGLGLEISGIAHNGLEALEMVKTYQPDILVTDIRMPGCSGLELIERAKEDMPALEMIIISGYAHFEYAQQAIKYGVGDYLLKPISKAELTATLQKLGDRVREQRKNAQNEEELRRKSEQDIQLLQETLITDLVNQKGHMPGVQELRNRYHLKAAEGIYQSFVLKMDCGRTEIGAAAAGLLMEKARETLELQMNGTCLEWVVSVQGRKLAGILNYQPEKKEEIRKGMKSCINQLELQKSLFRPISFSVALGRASEVPEELGESMEEALLLIQERLIYGRGRLYERMGGASALLGSGVVERYFRDMTHAVEVLSPEQLEEAVKVLEEECTAGKEVRGYEILDTVRSAAEVFAVRTQMAERLEFLNRLQQQIENCGSAQEVFQCLKEQCCEYLKQLSIQQETESVRPIRKAKQYIQEHYSEPITQEEVSSAVGLSPAYFSVLFKKTEGEGFAKYLIQVRMEQAKILLRESNHSVAEICRLVGYSDVKHFTHTFEKAAGVKPAVYRKLYG